MLSQIAILKRVYADPEGWEAERRYQEWKAALSSEQEEALQQTVMALLEAGFKAVDATIGPGQRVQTGIIVYALEELVLGFKKQFLLPYPKGDPDPYTVMPPTR